MKKFRNTYSRAIVILLIFFSLSAVAFSPLIFKPQVALAACSATPKAGETDKNGDPCPGAPILVRGGGNASTTPGQQPSPNDGSGCGIFSLKGLEQCLTGLMGSIGWLILQMMSLILMIAGAGLDFIINKTIIHMADNLSGMTGINIAWKVIRDIMNIVFIFMLLYEGITLIIGVSNQKRARDFVVGIVLASLLINFSLFFTKVIIDASNVATIGFYNSIIGENDTFDTKDAAGTVTTNKAGLSSAFIGSLGLQGFFDKSVITATGGDNDKFLIMTLAGSVLFLITAFIFFAVSILFIVRYITLIILLMLSPIGYMGLAFPGMKKHASQWWDSLLGQCLFAPVYMIMTWVIITLMTSPGFINLQEADATKWSALVTQTPTDSIGLIINFVVIIGLVIASLVISKGFAKQGASQIGQFAGMAGSFAGGAVLGSAASLGRNTAGWAGNKIANNDKLKDVAANGNIFTRNLASATLKTGDKASKSTFDVRSTEGMKSLSKTAGLEFGKGADPKKVSFAKNLETQTKALEDKAKSLKPSDVAAEQAKNRVDAEMNSEAFKTAENKRKENYYASDDYRNSEQGKKDIENLQVKDDYEKSKKENEDLKKKKEDLVKKRAETKIPELQKQIDEEIEAAEAEIKAKDKETADLNKAFEAKKDAIKKVEDSRERWESEIKKNLITQKGGREEKKDKQGNITQDGIDSLHQQRVNKLAERLESNTAGAKARRWGSYVGVPLSIVMPFTPKSLEEKQAIAMKVRKVAKAKKPKDEIEDIIKKAGWGEAEAEEEKKPETPPAAPAATPTP